MEKYDIGIMTFWNVPNYGTFAQAYALQRVLQKLNENKCVRQIAHLDKKHYNFYYDKKAYLRTFPVWKKTFWKSFFVKNDNSDIDRLNMFLEAYNSIPHTKEIQYSNASKCIFEKVFLGSDIIWDFSLKPFNNDPMLFGGLLNAKQVNSYAASFGTIALNAEIPEYVAKYINEMKYISVRDEKSADIVEKISGTRPEVVLDPVWLWDFDNDSNVKMPNEEKYVLVYGQNFTDKFICNLLKYARENKYKIIALDCNHDEYEWCDRLIKQSELSPYEWIGYFKGASAVATSTFHGLTFGLLFKNKIAFCKTDFIVAKIKDQFEKLGLLDLLDGGDDVNRMFSREWDYSKIDECINREREVSLLFLKKACE